MRTRTLVAAAGLAGLLAAPAQADAAYFKDRTAQGKSATAGAGAGAGSGAGGASAAASGPRNAYWKGRTRQGRTATVRTGADGLVTRVRIRWRARCSNGVRPLKGGTVFVLPIDRREPRAFEDGGTTPAKQLDDGVVAQDTAFVRGVLGRGGAWRGTFHVRAEFRRGGELPSRCRMKTRWRARRAG